jgi:LacI family transcriptional regulator
VSQTATILRDEIKRGTWKQWLPGERALCENLQVCRNTLRAALTQLKRDGVIRSDHGTGNFILLRTTGQQTRALKSHDVGLLSPEALERLRPSLTLWIDELRAMLSERGCRLHVFHGPQYFRSNPASALEKLVSQHPHGCWILALSERASQEWFAKKGLPCVVAGSVHDAVDLPFRDLDHRAICRHSAGLMLGHGHRKVALLIQNARRAGDVESEVSFTEGIRGSPHSEAEVAVVYHNASVKGIMSAMRRLMGQKAPPTALLVANAYHYLTVIGCLTQMGLRVPQDVSVVSRDEDMFLSFVVPTPTRYEASPMTMAKAILRPLIEVLEGGVITQRAHRIMPNFIRGETLIHSRLQAT